VAIDCNTLMGGAVSFGEEDRNRFGLIYDQTPFAIPITEVLEMDV